MSDSMAFNDERPHSVQALEYLLNEFIGSDDVSVSDFEAVENDGKRLILQCFLMAEYRAVLSSAEASPVETRERLASAVDESQEHALSGLFELSAIRADGHSKHLDTVYELVLGSVDFDRSRVFFHEASGALEDFLSYEARVVGDTVEYVESDDRRVSGTYLTPIQLAERCCRPSLMELVEDRCRENECWPGSFDSFKQLDADDAEKAREAILSLDLIDPASGTGSMLLAAVDLLTPIIARLGAGGDATEPGDKTAARKAIIQNCVYGVDVNRLSTDTTLGVFWLEAAESVDDSIGDLVSHVATGDSLLGPVRQQEIIQSYEKEDNNGRTYREDLKSINWGWEFPGVFSGGGFDAVVTNPPWERVKVQTREFFAGGEPELATVATTAEREGKLHRMENGEAKDDLQEAKDRAKAFADEIRDSEQYNWTNVGSLNLYSLFAERCLHLTTDGGKIGLLVPTGIATDYYTRGFFEHLMTTGRLLSLYDFENREKHFKDVDGRTRFSLVSIRDEPGEPKADFVFFARNPEDLDDTQKHVTLTSDEIAELNPNTKTAPLVRGRDALDILQTQHDAAPILSKETGDDEENPWGVDYFRMFDMSLDSDLFHQASDIEDGTQLQDGNILRDDTEYTRVYEGRMIKQYNHRASHARNSEDNIYRSGASEEIIREQLADPDFTVAARYYMTKGEVNREMADRDYDCDWFVGFKDITSATNTRTMIASVLPYTAVGNKVPILLADHPARSVACFLANLNSFAYDFACRQKIGNVTLNWYIVRQTPVFPPNTFDQTFRGQKLRDWVAERIAELTYTAHDLDAWGRDLDFAEEPYTWDRERRRELRVEIEALFFSLYGLKKDEVDHVFESFWSVKEDEVEEYDEYKLKHRVLDRLSEFQSLSPSP